MRNPHFSTGWVVTSSDTGVRFAGTCFAFRSGTLLLTAEHCVHGLEHDEITVTGARERLEPGYQVTRVKRHPSADVAALWIEQAAFDPFRDVSMSADWGDEVAAFGYPIDTIRDQVLPTPRYFGDTFSVYSSILAILATTTGRLSSVSRPPAVSVEGRLLVSGIQIE